MQYLTARTHRSDLPQPHPDATSGRVREKLARLRDRRDGAGAVVQEARNNQSCSEAFAAGTMRDRVRIRYFESAFLEVFAEIEKRAADEQRTLRINHHANIR